MSSMRDTLNFGKSDDIRNRDGEEEEEGHENPRTADTLAESGATKPNAPCKVAKAQQIAPIPFMISPTQHECRRGA